MTDENIQARVEAALGMGNAQVRSVPSDAASGQGKASIDMLMDVMLQLTVELGRANMTVSQVIDLQKGSVIELNRIAGESVDVFVNNRLLARGDVVVVDDKFGVRITELVSTAAQKGEE